LLKYGYLPPSDKSTGQLQAWTTSFMYVIDLELFFGLCCLDEDTITLMKTPRCSLPDQDNLLQPPSKQWRVNIKRKKRAISTWTNRNINWRLRSYPSSSHLSREMIRSLVFYALRVWAEPSSLRFHEVATSEAADLQVDFLHGYHGDSYPFDGAGGAVGHAFFPSDPAWAGGIHLDAEEEWVFRQPVSEGTDLFTVLVHEVGHALGLTHSSSRHSVMRPYYLGPAGDPLHYSLGAEDLEHITQLYGKRKQLLVTDVPHLAWKPSLQHRHHHQCTLIDRCNTSFDTVARIRGETFFFKGLTMWRVNGGGLVSAHGTSVRRLWRGLPPDLPHLDAVLERQSNHAIIFISGSQFWLFKGLSLQEGYPQPLSALRFAPGFFNDRANFLPERKYKIKAQHLCKLKHFGTQITVGPQWEHLAKMPNAALKEFLGSVYLFKNDTYWKFAFPGSTLQDGYPRSSAVDWLDCSDSSS
uniref:Matrix metallopeptidase 17b n=1 Tax=Tetraodon nigroviridis TaxID=99883 RepID=H3CJ23_TETNG